MWRHLWVGGLQNVAVLLIVEHEIYFYSSFVWSNVQGCSWYFTMQINIGFKWIDCPIGTLRIWWVLFHVGSRMFLIFHDANQHWVQMDYIVEHEIYFYPSFVWSNVQGCSGYFTMQISIGFKWIDCSVGTLRFWWVLFHVDSGMCLIFHEANHHWVQVHGLPCWDFENLISSFPCWYLYSKQLCCTASEVRLRPFLICYVQCKYKYYLSNYFDETKDVDEDEIVVKLSD